MTHDSPLRILLFCDSPFVSGIEKAMEENGWVCQLNTLALNVFGTRNHQADLIFLLMPNDGRWFPSSSSALSCPILGLFETDPDGVGDQLIHWGAMDYVVGRSGRWPGLAWAAQRALREWRRRKKSREVDIQRRSELFQKEVSETDTLFHQLTENIHEVFWLDDWQANNTLYVSRAFEVIWGISVKEIYKNQGLWWEAIHKDDRQRVKASYFSKAVFGEFDECFRVIRPDGSVRWVRDRGFPVKNTRGEVYRIAGIAEDITQSRETEKNRVRLETQLRQVQRMEAIGQLTGGIAHDFNNILACILGYTDLAIQLYGNEPGSKLSKYLGEVFQAAERARDLVSQMLLFSRGGKGEPKPLLLQNIIGDTLKMLKSMLPTTIEVDFRASPDAGPVMIDSVQFQQLIMNLCVNASGAMGVHGTLAVKVTKSRIDNNICASCHGRVDGNFVEISVSDTGGGIPIEVRDKIFEPFFTTKPVGKGTGMGLSVVHGIIHEHGGHILVESDSGNGTAFRVMFQSVEEKAQDQSRRDAALRKSQLQGDGEWIMVVDDEDAIVGLFSDIFRSWGYEVAAFTESQKALERFKAQPGVFKLMLTDQTMPKLTGTELAREVLTIRPDLPIILCTGYSELVDEKKAKDLKISGFLHKPVEIYKLSNLVQKLIPS